MVLKSQFVILYRDATICDFAMARKGELEITNCDFKMEWLLISPTCKSLF